VARFFFLPIDSSRIGTPVGKAFRPTCAHASVRWPGPDPTHKVACIEATLTKENDMLKWAIIFAAIALVAGVFGFTGIAAGAAGIAKFLFVLFLVLFVAVVLIGLLGAKAISNK
jgi:uncharacterized membrane protein YtjA (UPF0391 family)